MTLRAKRREFLKHAGAFTGIAAMAPGLVAGSQANSAVTLGLIGCGGRGNWLSNIFVKNVNARIVVCPSYFFRDDDFAVENRPLF